MNRVFVYAVFLSLLIIQSYSSTLSLTVVTYNLECSVCDESYPWSTRLTHFQEIFFRNQPDILGSQELLFKDEIQQIIKILPKNYGQQWDAVYYQVNSSYNADATIFYRSDIFKVLSNGSYWLSPTPNIPFSTGFSNNQVVPRLVVWAVLQHLTGVSFFISNTHFDNNTPCQEKSAPLVLQQTSLLNTKNLPVLFTGDFNSDFNTTAYHTLITGTNGFYLHDSFTLAQSWSIETNQQPIPKYDPQSSIDHIFVQAPENTNYSWNVPLWQVDMYAYPYGNQTYPSDHLAITAHLQLQY